MKTDLEVLIEQYKRATGIKHVDQTSLSFLRDLLCWIEQRQKISKNYVTLLDNMQVNYNSEHCAEIGKTMYDSVVLPFDTTIITPYTTPADVKHPGRIIEADFKLVDATPMIFKILNGKLVKRTIESDQIKTYMTQNPYTSDEIKDWRFLHNCGDNNIIVGVFGNVYDQDIDEKLKMMKRFALQLTNGKYVEDFGNIGDTYCYAVASNRAKILEKVKTR